MSRYTDPRHYKNIIFDLGGVLLNLDIARTEEAFLLLGMADLETIYSHSKQTGLFDLYETGKISSMEFRKEMRKFLDPKTSDVQIDHAWNAMLLDMPAERIALLEEVRHGHKIFLLSNTNEIHMEAYHRYMQARFGFRDLSHLFIKQYLSFEIGRRKPDADVFDLVVKEHGLRKEETLFIDDSLHHIEGARKYGIDAIWLERNRTVLDLFGK